MKNSLLILFIALSYIQVLAQELTADELLKSVEVINPRVEFEKQFESSEINKWGSADPNAKVMIIAYYSTDGDSLILDDEREMTRTESSDKDHWKFIRKNRLTNSKYELEYDSAIHPDQKTIFVIENNQLLAKYTEIDSVAYHYFDGSLSRVDFFEKNARLNDGSVIYEDELENNGKGIIIEETVIEKVQEDVKENLIEEISYEDIVEEVGEDVYETTVSLGSDEDDYIEIVEIVPVPTMRPRESLLYTYDADGLMTSVRRLINNSYQGSSQVTELKDQFVRFTYNDSGLLASFHEQRKLLKTAEDLPANLSLVYWLENAQPVTRDYNSLEDSDFEVGFTYNSADQLESLKMKQSSNGETNSGAVRIAYNSYGASRIEIDEEKKKEVMIFDYDDNGYLIKETQERYRNGELVDKRMKTRTFIYE